ncbi:MAG: 50S ribosomal protein L24 [Alcanivorax borkumensis]|jgi:large subunit ribosomal protein L24|uniref:Large ribosomal subunit protein uL24 n=1 Tax=Alcanivorax borkumensis (strain ATCC 700651 / DSM 11573 / NCIMB 13689 / SK2) TaxID=393595 RepID=RL24_ALCBS|nr:MULTISPECIES: 50S ribosomal protein L24 [Alcanivorax]Q0VSJ2.1 RecName: Full=Large ribosomal subunit protein uL24; AltName: Full=50S ribosomal protein L24 [Alcanivorax borkumensis SK2]OJH07337.1 MAG: 50S ribosomal protein L24 [Alcanivorax borkumensis]EUC68184.1 50S ribosomal protein L24 [Alcanivorax sp. 97CO-5]PKG00554.1 50S ribosomal protein L24 [Alcanivorax sp. 97CO-6]CAL15856.1 50S ribosomal protein L24 [Alcanivorax borkumensis SK2]BAP13273.1 50S ribosomal protein L24 [Alcanivorax sp. NB
MLKIKRDDEIIVIAGKDKGKRGSVQQVLDNGRLIVAGVNMVKKHVKANPNRGTQGGIVEQEASLNASNVAIWNPKTQKADRVGFRFEDGKKVRFFKSNGEAL